MNKRMLVLNVEVSGMNKYLLSQLQKRGWSLTVVNVPYPGRYRWMALISTFSPNISQWKKRFDQKLNKYHKSSAAFLQRTKFCQKKIKELDGQFDLIFQISGMFAPYFDQTKTNKPYVTYNDYTLMLSYTMALSDGYSGWTPLADQKNKWIDLEKQLYADAKMIFTTNENARKSLIDDYGIEAEKIIKAGYGLTLDSIPDTQKTYDGKTILFIGMDFERKGGYVLLEAFKKVKEQIPDARLIIVGPNKDVFQIDQPGVKLLGVIKDRKIIDDLYRQASIFVMPSLCEPFGLVFLEAMAYQLPCIGTTLDAMPEIIEDGKTGFIVPPKDAQTLAEKLITLLNNQDLMKNMGVQAQKRVKEQFSWENVGERIDSYLSRTFDKE
ncbi:glycosyltransferase family 4 protein [Candidatus Omnitrophota bacterium]